MSPHSGPPLWELTVTRVKEFVRVPEALFWVFVFPLVLAVALGFAFREKGPDRIPIGVSGPRAEQLMRDLATSEALDPVLFGEQEGRAALGRGRVSLLVESSERELTYRYDPSRPDAHAARLEVDHALQSAAGRRDPVLVTDVHVEERGSRYIDFLIPGLLGMNLMGTGMWGVGFSIATARMQKLLKRLTATPMRKRDYMLSHMFSRLAFLVPEVSILIVFAWWMFDVEIHGSILLMAAICLLGAVMFSGIGLLVASRARTLEGVSGLMNFVMVPMWILSGIFFSAERFPDFAQPAIQVLPLTALNDALRAVMNQALSFGDVMPEIAIMASWGIVSFAIALRVFRWS